MDRAGITTFYHKDGLGSVTELSALSQNLVGSYKYDVFGSIRSQTGSVVNPYLFTSRAFDAESGLYYYRARYYKSDVGRFISRDPLLNRRFATPGCASCGLSGLGGDGDMLSYLLFNPQALNAYTYVTNNPVTSSDPLGLCECDPMSCYAAREDCLKSAREATIMCMSEVAATAANYGNCLVACLPAAYFGGIGYASCLSVCETSNFFIHMTGLMACNDLGRSLKSNCEAVYQRCMGKCK